MVRSNKKRKNRSSGGRAQPSIPTPNNTEIDAMNTSIPDLPPLNLPTFNLINDTSSISLADSPNQQPPHKKVKKEKIHARDVPEFCVSPAKLKRVLRVSDLQELVLWLVADGVAPQWLLVKRKQEIKNVVVVMVPGLDMELMDGTINLTENAKLPEELTPQTGQDEDDVGELIVREDDDLAAVEAASMPEIPDAKTEDASVVEVTQERKVVDPDEVIDDEGWTVVGGKGGDPESKAFNFYPSLLAGRPLAPCLATLRDIFTHVWPTKTDGDERTNKVISPIQLLLSAKVEKSNVPHQKLANGSSRIGISKLIMTPEELIENEYPLHSASLRKLLQHRQGPVEDSDEWRELQRLKSNGWVETSVEGTETVQHNEGGSVTEGYQVYSVDCEMCTSDNGQELTRISVVNWNGEVIYDTLVKPANPITNYLTQFSGITEEKLHGITTTINDVQQHLLKLFSPPHKVILVGQSLNSDLRALQFLHPYIVDTSVIFDHPKGRPYKSSLKFLAQKYLKREIQRGQHMDPFTKQMEPGHDSVEDALACVDLVKLKLEKGLKFGSQERTSENVFTRIERGHASSGTRHGACWSALVDYSSSSRMYAQAAKKVVTCNNDDEVVAGIREVLGWKPVVNTDETIDPRARLAAQGEIRFVWARLRELEVVRGYDNPNRSALDVDNLPPLPGPVVDPPAHIIANKAGETVNRLKQIYNSLPPNTAFIVYSGTGDPREMSRLNTMWRRFREEFKVKPWDSLSVKWTDAEEQELKRAIKRCREGGVCFLKVKNEDG